MTSLKKIGVLTSGGDCPGLNAVIRGLTLRADESYGCEVIGIHDGHLGLLKDPPDVQTLTPGHFPASCCARAGRFSAPPRRPARLYTQWTTVRREIALLK